MYSPSAKIALDSGWTSLGLFPFGELAYPAGRLPTCFATNFADIPDVWMQLAEAYLGLAKNHAKAGNLEASSDTYDRALSYLRKIGTESGNFCDQHPDDPDEISKFMYRSRMITYLFRRNDRAGEVAGFLQRAVDRATKFLNAHIGDRSLESNGAVVLMLTQSL